MTSRIFLLLMVLLQLVACGSSPVKTRYYTLHPNQEMAPLGELSQRSIGIGPIILPETLQRGGVMTLGEQNAVLVADDHRWAGDLKQSISRIIALNVGTLLDSGRVWPYPWDVRDRPEIQVKLAIEQLSGSRGGDVVLQAKWQIFANQGADLVAVEQALLKGTADGSSYNDYVAAINELVNQVSKQVAASLLQHLGEA